jgi:hypothetical protein
MPMIKGKKFRDLEVEEIMAKFNYAYMANMSAYERMDRINKAYGNEVSSISWPTIANCSIPLTFMSIEEQLPQAMKYLFPKNRFIELLPSARMDRDKVRRVEDNLRYTVKVQMDSEIACFPSIKDCFKYAVGYGLVDTEMITPPEVRILEADIGGETVSRIPQLELGGIKQVTVYKYIPTICVIPMPGGANVDGPNRAEGHFVIVFVTESSFRDMYEQKGLDGKPMLSGDVEKIIAEARAMNFDYRMPTPDKIANLAGIQITRTNNGDKKMPVMIPIVRWYEDHHQMWIANGRTKIYQVKEKYQTLRSDLVKWSAWPDGNEWFPLGVTEASEKLALGTNIWYNGLIDLAMYHINPVRMINTKLVENPSNVARSPRSDIKVTGRPEDAVGYMKLPDFPAQLMTMGDVFQRFHANANGIMTGAQDRSPGLVRGGSNALEQLLSSSTGRQFLASIILKTGGLKPMIEKTLIKKQLIMDEDGDTFVERAYDPKTGDYVYNEQTVTLEEMRHIFRVELNMPEPRSNEMGDFSRRTAVFDRAQKSPELFDQRALYEYLEEDDAAIRRIMLPDDVVKERQQRMAEANMKSAETQALTKAEQNAQVPTSQGEQANAGAMEASIPEGMGQQLTQGV